MWYFSGSDWYANLRFVSYLSKGCSLIAVDSQSVMPEFGSWMAISQNASVLVIVAWDRHNDTKYVDTQELR
jgi:hypothetical protein